MVPINLSSGKTGDGGSLAAIIPQGKILFSLPDLQGSLLVFLIIFYLQKLVLKISLC